MPRMKPRRQPLKTLSNRRMTSRMSIRLIGIGGHGGRGQRNLIITVAVIKAMALEVFDLRSESGLVRIGGTSAHSKREV